MQFFYDKTAFQHPFYARDGTVRVASNSNYDSWIQSLYLSGKVVADTVMNLSVGQGSIFFRTTYDIDGSELDNI